MNYGLDSLDKLSRETGKLLRQLINHDEHTPDSTTKALHEALDHLSKLKGLRRANVASDDADLNFDMRERDGEA